MAWDELGDVSFQRSRSEIMEHASNAGSICPMENVDL